MLQSLRVKNLAIVEDVNVSFGSGLNVMTGETGAGKSIIVGALGLVLGERADKSLIRASEEKCTVEAVFEIGDSVSINAALENLGIEPCEDGHLLIRRIMLGSGSGRNFINDCPATLQALKTIGDLLLDMHGPHDHQSLLDRDFQLDLLDSFGHLLELKGKYEAEFRRMLDCEAQLRTLDGDDHEIAQQIDMLKFQISEIKSAGIEGMDEEEMMREHSIVGNAQRILEIADGLVSALTDGNDSAFDRLSGAQRLLTELKDIFPKADAWHSEAGSIAVQIQELSNDINSAVQNIEGDPGRLQWLEDRISLIRKLKRKYGATTDEIMTFLESAKKRLNELETRGERVATIVSELNGIREKIKTIGADLSKNRKKCARELEKAITWELKALGFESGVFNIDITMCEPRSSGLNEVNFGFAPNTGEPMRPLRLIASSGEISRVMLATKTVLASHDRIPVLVFDEIDANVGGEMGNAVGTKLAAVAEKHQVICITHLPQVAAHGTTHLVVNKNVRAGRTYTNIRVVSGEERISEIARMLGGKDLTSVTLKHAEEMLQNRWQKQI
ncbi:MAG: DNA repair protein RecN [Lentisphaerae bacterium]|nr:DNA repair protein RecN [Lentisphaerota bacterium]